MVSKFIAAAKLFRPPPRHIGLGFVSHPLFKLLPPFVSALVALLLCFGPRCLHVLLVCDSGTQYPCVLQYPVRSNIANSSACVYTFSVYGLQLPVSGAGVAFAGALVGGKLSYRAMRAWIWVRREAILMLLLVSALARLLRQPLMEAVSIVLTL